MIISVSDWIAFLRGSDALLAVPLMVIGIGLMLFGWRLWKACVVLAFGLIGAAIGTMFAKTGNDQALYAVGGGLLLAGLSYRPVNHALALLGGLIGAGLIMNTLADAGLTGTPLWIGGAAGLIACGALAFLNRRVVVIGVTAFMGAILFVSGVTVVVMSSSSLYGTLNAMMKGSVIVMPFLLVVPTVMSAFYQVAEVHRTNTEL